LPSITGEGLIGKFSVGPNLVVNGDFEDWTTGTDCDGWEEFLLSGGTITKETTKVAGGTAAVAANTPDGLAEYPSFYQYVPLEAGVTYTLSVKFALSVSVASQTYFFNLTAPDGKNLHFDGTFAFGGNWGDMQAITTTYGTRSMIFVAPQTGNYTLLLSTAYSSEAHSVYMDDLSIQEVIEVDLT
jgi:hypothetical protein